MEGYLVKWTNIISRWKKRYVMVDKERFTYYKKKDGRMQGSHSLRNVRIEMVHSDPAGFLLKFEDGEIMKFRASDSAEKQKWLVAIQAGKIFAGERMRQDSAVRSMPQDGAIQLKSELIEILRNKILNGSSKLSKDLASIMTLQEQLESTVGELIQCLTVNSMLPSGAAERAETIQSVSKELRAKLQDAALEIEDAKADLTNAVKSIVSKTKINTKNIDPFSTDSDKSPQSAPAEESKVPSDSVKEHDNPATEKEDADSSEENSSFYEEVFYDAVSDNTFVPSDTKPNALVPSSQPTEEPEYRTTLPVKRNNKKFSFWVILKDMIGKDLTKISLPVYFNEPSGLLQRTAEGFENDYLLDKAATDKNPYLRLAYIAAFNASQYNGSYGRNMKPFNPLLGETFEYVTERYQFFSEQVSHHPPICACHCESKNYTAYFNTQVTNKFWGNSIEFRPLGKTYIHLKTIDEHYTVNRPSINAQNIIFGQLYLDLSGESVVENCKTGDKCVVKFHSKGWSDDSLGKLDGYVITKSGEKVYKLEGKWCDSIWATDLKTGDTIPIWKKFPLPEDWKSVYCFTMQALQLNYLTEKLKKVLPPTDTRFRPDQRAYENGDIKLASTEKYRLEEKQRAARRAMEKNKIKYKPAYFVLTVDPVTKETNYIFNGKYWLDREKGDWSHMPDIFGK